MKNRLIPLITFLLFVTGLSARAQTNAWLWQSSMVPRSLVFEGVWSDLFKVKPALHLAGVRHQSYYMTDLPDVYPDLHQRSVIVLINAAAPYLEQQQIKDFVANGGGLVILGGFWTFNCGGFRGGYNDGVLVDTIPVNLSTNFDVPGKRDGWPLTRAASATWLKPFDTAAKPMVYYRHEFVPKPGAEVQMLAGDHPIVVSHTFGKGRVVAIGLTVNGDPPAGALAFWEWPEWPRVLAQAIDWAASGRPAGSAVPVTSALKPLTKDEINDLTLGMKVPPNLVARSLAYPTAESAQALFEQLFAPEGKLTVVQALPALLPFAKPEWGERLVERTTPQNPVLAERNASLVLLGATRWPTASARLLKVIDEPDTRLAAMEGLGYCGDPVAIPTLTHIYDSALRSAQVPKETERFLAEPFAGSAATLATEAALALYRLGDPKGVDRVVAMHRRVLMYWHVYHVAGRASMRNAGAAAIARMQNIWDRTGKLAAAFEKLNRHDTPIPPSQIAPIAKIAQTTTDSSEVEWIADELERSRASVPEATWQTLTTAQDGIIARLARTALEKPNKN